ncbi:glycosyltransferase family 2 protein [Candidatus Woesebacteria bacterium]|nr:glycosyltransferase family 2 protein [Candidatus Woesebacteria bacterium]
MASNNSNKTELELSIIILSYNTSQLTKETLESIFVTTQLSPESFEVIVLDNASSDDSVETIKELQSRHASIRLMESKVNLGFSKGNNTAVREAKGTYLLFLNSDIVVQKRGVDNLYAFIKDHPNAAFAGGKLLNADMSPQSSCGPFYSLPVVFGALFLRGDYWGLTRYSPDSVKQVDWVSGACLMTTSNVFESVGGFDEDIFMYMEEIDLLYRAQKKNLKTFFVPDARFIHLGSASSKGRTFPIIQVYRGFLYFYKKHCSSSALFVLKGMLQLKAQVAILLGKILSKPHLVETYGKAQKMVDMD